MTMELCQHVQAAVTIFACTISGGLVALPRTYQLIGFLPALVLSAIAGCANGLSLLTLSIISRRSGVATYSELACHIGGPVLAALIDTLVGAFLLGVLSGTLIVVRDWTDWIFAHNERHAKLATFAIAAFGIFPLALPRTIGNLAYASTFSIGAFSLLVGVLVYYGAVEVARGDVASFDELWLHGGEVHPLDLGRAFNVFVYAFACQFQLMAIYQDLLARLDSPASAFVPTTPPLPPASASRAPPTIVQADQRDHRGPPSAGSLPDVTRRPPPLRFALVIGAATCAMLVLFCSAGIFGVLAFPGQVIDGNILKTLEAKPLGRWACACARAGGRGARAWAHPCAAPQAPTPRACARSVRHGHATHAGTRAMHAPCTCAAAPTRTSSSALRPHPHAFVHTLTPAHSSAPSLPRLRSHSHSRAFVPTRARSLTYACLGLGVTLSAPLLVHPARSCLLAIGSLGCRSNPLMPLPSGR